MTMKTDEAVADVTDFGVLTALREANTRERAWHERLMPYDDALEVIAERFAVGRRSAVRLLQDAAGQSHVTIVRTGGHGRRIETRREMDGKEIWDPPSPHPTRGIVDAGGAIHLAEELPSGTSPAPDGAQWVGLAEMVVRTFPQMITYAGQVAMTARYGDALATLRAVADRLGCRMVEHPTGGYGGRTAVTMNFADDQIAAVAAFMRHGLDMAEL
jgi:hypothetical protein